MHAYINYRLGRLNSFRHFLLTITDFGLNLTRCKPDSERTRDRATYAIPAPNTITDKSTMQLSRDSPWLLCMVMAG